jgi:pimeloyl-ACP methyl ester carboxylesterase
VSAVAVTPPWTLAYRPLRLRSLLLQVAALIVAEVGLFASYQGHEASFHWATHFLVGLSVAALTNLVWLALKGAPARWQLLSVLAWHLVAMFPDLLFSAGVPHDGWMNIFLGHIAAHYVPGGAVSWLFVALTLSALYCILLAAWLQARTIEADAGLPPGIGVGGRSLVRAQQDPRVVSLAHERHGPDRPPDVLLLHGLGASRELWRPVTDELAAGGRAVLVCDLLGFGASRTIGTRFGLDDHVAAIRALLERYPGQPVVVVGHSFGCAVAAALAAAEPERVHALVLVSPPVFRDPAEARMRLGERGWLARKVLSGSPVASFTCGAMCLLRAPAGHLLARLARDLPERVVRDSVQHTWPAYRDALEALLDHNPLPRAIAQPSRPTTVVVGDADTQTPAEDVLDWPHDAVDVSTVPGADHLLPLTHSAAVTRATDILYYEP